jgi:hypothetical protein
MGKVGSISLKPVSNNNELRAVYSSHQKQKNAPVQNANNNKVENKMKAPNVGQKVDLHF